MLFLYVSSIWFIWYCYGNREWISVYNMNETNRNWLHRDIAHRYYIQLHLHCQQQPSNTCSHVWSNPPSSKFESRPDCFEIEPHRGMILQGEKKIIKIRLKPEYRPQAEKVGLRNNVVFVRATYYCEYNKKLLVKQKIHRKHINCMAGAAFPNSSRKVTYPSNYALRPRCKNWRSLSDRVVHSKTPEDRIVSKNLGTLLLSESKTRN